MGAVLSSAGSPSPQIKRQRAAPATLVMVPYKWSGVAALPWDVIQDIMEHIESRRDLSRVMRAHRVLFDRGLSKLLRSHIRLTQDNLESFCLFMKDTRRPTFLRDISCCFTSFPNSNAVLAFMQAMEYATRLKKLSFTAEAVDCDYRMIVAFSNLKSVESLHVLNYSPGVGRVLRDMHSPVLEADISFAAPGTDRGDLQPFLYMCARYSQTLEVLKVNHASSHDLPKMYSIPQYPRLRELHLADYAVQDITVLEHALPALRVLRASDGVRSSNPDRRYRSPGPERRPWPLLQSAHITVGSRYLHDIASPISNLTVIFGHMPQPEVDRLQAFFFAARPEKLTVTYADAQAVGHVNTLLQILSHTPPRVKQLSLMWYRQLSQRSWLEDIKAVANTLRDQANMEELLLQLFIIQDDEARRTMYSWPRHGDVVWVTTLGAASAGIIAHHFATVIPSMSRITIVWQDAEGLNEKTVYRFGIHRDSNGGFRVVTCVNQEEYLRWA